MRETTSTQTQVTYLLFLIILGMPVFVLMGWLFPEWIGVPLSPSDPQFLFVYGPALFTTGVASIALFLLHRFFSRLEAMTTSSQPNTDAHNENKYLPTDGPKELQQLAALLRTTFTEKQKLQTQNLAHEREVERIKKQTAQACEVLTERVGRVLDVPIELLPWFSQHQAGKPKALEALRKGVEETIERVNTQNETLDRVVSMVQTQQLSSQTLQQRLFLLRRKSGLLSTAMTELGERTQRMGQIAASLKLLANEIDHVALNATIEAARVGEAGRGFSIVTAEFRSLAEQSKTAANTMRQLLEEIAHSSKTTLSFAQEGEQGVDELLEAARQSESTSMSLQTESRQSKELSSEITSVLSDVGPALGQLEQTWKQLESGGQELIKLTAQKEEVRRAVATAESALAAATQGVVS